MMYFRHFAAFCVLAVATVAVGQASSQYKKPTRPPGQVRYEPVTGSDRVFYEASHLNRYDHAGEGS